MSDSEKRNLAAARQIRFDKGTDHDLDIAATRLGISVAEIVRTTMAAVKPETLEVLTLKDQISNHLVKVLKPEPVKPKPVAPPPARRAAAKPVSFSFRAKSPARA